MKKFHKKTSDKPRKPAMIANSSDKDKARPALITETTICRENVL